MSGHSSIIQCFDFTNYMNNLIIVWTGYTCEEHDNPSDFFLDVIKEDCSRNIDDVEELQPREFLSNTFNAHICVGIQMICMFIVSLSISRAFHWEEILIWNTYS